MERRLTFGFLFLCVSLFIGNAIMEGANLEPSYSSLMDLLSKIDHVEIQTVHQGYWPAGFSSIGGPAETLSLSLEVVFRGKGLIVELALFGNDEMARRAAALHTRMGTARYSIGSFSGSACPGEGCWNLEDYALVVQSGNLCQKVYASDRDWNSKDPEDQIAVIDFVDKVIAYYRGIGPLAGFSVNRTCIENDVPESELTFLADDADLPGLVLIQEGGVRPSRYLSTLKADSGQPWSVQYFREGNQGFDEFYVLYRRNPSAVVAEAALDCFAPLDSNSSMASLARVRMTETPCPGDECRFDWRSPQFSLIVRLGLDTVIVRKIMYDPDRVKAVSQCFRLAEAAIARLQADNKMQSRLQALDSSGTGTNMIDPLTCECGAEMKIIAFITEQRVVRQILEHLERVGRRPGRSPPECAA